MGSGSATVDAGRDYSEGSLRPSNDPLAVAIDGPGFFKLRRADGSTALTRAGSFRLDGSGSLVTANGEQLDPPLTLPKGVTPADITIAADRTVSAKGAKLGTITVL